MNMPAGIGETVERLRRTTVLIGDGRGSSGSGVIVNANGEIATNAHVVRTSRTMVQTWDGKSYDARLKSIDRAQDLALLSVSASGLASAVLGDSHHLQAGELVVAIGNPFGFIGAATMGVVHSIGPIHGLGSSEWIQSDLKLAPGNSGGPLANAAGEVVGLNSMIIRGLGVAIPSNSVRRFMEPTMSQDRLGIAVRSINMNLRGERCLGLLILEIETGSPAEIASLLPGDVLIGTDHGLFRTTEDLYSAIEGYGERIVRLHFLRGNNAHPRIATALLGTIRNKAA